MKLSVMDDQLADDLLEIYVCSVKAHSKHSLLKFTPQVSQQVCSDFKFEGKLELSSLPPSFETVNDGR